MQNVLSFFLFEKKTESRKIPVFCLSGAVYPEPKHCFILLSIQLAIVLLKKTARQLMRIVKQVLAENVCRLVASICAGCMCINT